MHNVIRCRLGSKFGLLEEHPMGFENLEFLGKLKSYDSGCVWLRIGGKGSAIHCKCDHSPRCPTFPSELTVSTLFSTYEAYPRSSFAVEWRDFLPPWLDELIFVVV